MERRFPIMHPEKGQPRSVPWHLVAPHETNAQVFHDQTLERLAERGGLAWPELFCVMTGVPWHVAFPTPGKEHGDD